MFAFDFNFKEMIGVVEFKQKASDDGVWADWNIVETIPHRTESAAGFGGGQNKDKTHAVRKHCVWDLRILESCVEAIVLYVLC